MKRKGQTWVLDIFLGVGIFLFAFSLLVKSYGEASSESDILEDMSINAKMISEMLLSEGIPVDWNSTDVRQPGLISEGRISHYKLQELKAMDYDEVRSIFRTRYDYLIDIQDSSGASLQTIGPAGVTIGNLPGLEPDNVLKMNRLSVYNSSPVRLVVVVWEG
mgnify:CR=1 FL=1